MKTDEEMKKIDYVLVLKQLQVELDGIDGRRQALQASIASLNRLVEATNEQPFLTDLDIPSQDRNGKPAIPPGFFAGKTPTQAYRDFTKLWPGDYRPPQIADAFQDGGIETESRTRLIQAIHSVLKRDRARRERMEEKKRTQSSS